MNKEPIITPAQLNYAEILLNDLGIAGDDKKMPHINDILGGTDYQFISQLTKKEGIVLISTLKKWKETKAPKKVYFDTDEDDDYDDPRDPWTGKMD